MPLKPILKMRERKIRSELIKFMPQKIIDIHAHIGLPSHQEIKTNERKKSPITGLGTTASTFLLSKTYKTVFPGKEVKSVIFPFPFKETRIEKANRYVLNESQKNERLFPFVLADIKNPEKTVSLLGKKEVKGLKVYYEQVDWKNYLDISINDFINEKMLDSLDKKNGILMLHVPRNSIADKKNSVEVRDIALQHPHIKIILAHMGRTHMSKRMQKTIQSIKDLKNVYMETSTCSDPETIRLAIKNLGFKRILFGSDFPYALERGKYEILKNNPRFITINKYPFTSKEQREFYLNKRRRGEANYVMNVYHSVKAVKDACNKLGLGKKEIEYIFYKNAKNFLNGVK